jgi:hypothetical protein
MEQTNPLTLAEIEALEYALTLSAHLWSYAVCETICAIVPRLLADWRERREDGERVRPYARHMPWCAAEETDCGCACGLTEILVSLDAARAKEVPCPKK